MCEINTLDTLNLRNVVHQLYLNRARGKKGTVAVKCSVKCSINAATVKKKKKKDLILGEEVRLKNRFCGKKKKNPSIYM